MLKQITPIILTFNEAPNIKRTLAALSWAERVLVIDSFSTDDTLEICASFDNVSVLQNHFENFAQQCNFALQQDIHTEWVLSMDADYIVTPLPGKNMLVSKELSEILSGRPLTPRCY